jgi:hypothetical protein
VTNSNERVRVDASGNVGIGTTNPKNILDIHGFITTRFTSGDYIGLNVYWDNTNWKNQVANASVGAYALRQGDDRLQIYTSTGSATAVATIPLTEKLCIQASTGNVGIGTATPTTKLHVDGDTTIRNGSILIGNPNVTQSTTQGIYWNTLTDTDYAIHRTLGPWAANAYQQLRLSWATGIILAPGSSYDKSYVDVQGKMLVTGNVGIGTANPTAKLDVAGDMKLSGSLTMPSLPAFHATGVTMLSGGNIRYQAPYLTYSGMDITTGVFTCLVTGLYKFDFTAFSASGSSLEVHAIKNGGKYGERGFTGGNTSYTPIMNSFIVQLNVNDTIVMRVVFGSLYSNSDHGMFCGHRIG